jgi:glycosyltransferase involved in cell wall biosynthesis
MRFLQLVTRRQHRGAEVFAAQLSDGLARNGHEVTLVGLYPPTSDELIPLAAGAHDLSGHPASRLSYRLVSELSALIQELRPDIVQANGSATLKYASLAKTLSRGRWPLVYRNIGIASHWLHYPGHRWWSRWLLRNVGHVAAVSQHSGEDFSRTFGVRASRISTIPVGVDIPPVPRLPELRERLIDLTGMPSDAEILMHVGSFTPEKNHAWLVESFARLCETRPRVHLVLVGAGALRPEVEAAVAARSLTERIHFLGTRSDVPQLVGGADLFVMSSTTEGISGVILEAAAQAIPTVSTDVGSISEAVKQGVTGLLVPSGDLDGFISAISGLLDDPARRRAMGDAAYAFVKEAFAMERVIGRFEQLYTELSDGTR